MTNYRRSNISGAAYFFTVNLAERKRTYLIDHIDLLKRVIRAEMAKNPFTIDAIVILPEHLHAIWTLPENDADFSNRWRCIKAAFSTALPKNERRSVSRESKGERGIWQRRFWEHLIRDDIDYARHVDYIHFNPVKHGHVTKVRDWPHSSFHRWVREGKLSDNWAGTADEHLVFGER
jgi:putative transposase